MFLDNSLEHEITRLKEIGPPANSIVVTEVGKDRLAELMKPVLTRVESPTSLGRKRSSKHSTDELGDRSNVRQMSSKSFTNSAAMRSERSLESRELTLNSRPAGFVNNPLSMLVVGGEGDDSPHRHRKLVLFKKKRRRGRDSSPSERKIGGLIIEGSRSKSRSPPPQKKGGLFSPLIADRPFLLAKEKSVAKAQKNHHEEKEYVHNLFRKGDKILDRIIQEKNVEQNRLQQRLADIHHTVYERDHWASLGWIKRKQIGKDFDKYFATKPREEDSKSLLNKQTMSSPRKAAVDPNWRPAWVKIVGKDRHTRSMEHSNLSRISNQPSSRHRAPTLDQVALEDAHSGSFNTEITKTLRHQEFRIKARLSHSSETQPIAAPEEPTYSVPLLVRPPPMRKTKQILKDEEQEKLEQQQVRKQQALARLLMARKLVYNPRTLERIVPMPD